MSLLKILPVLALMFGPQALAQDALTKIEEGQMAISQCYSEYSQRHLEYVSVIVMGEESIGDRGYCWAEHGILQSLDTCKAGCTEMESAFGTTTSNARDRFLSVYNGPVGYLEPCGLWKTTGDQLRHGTDAFKDACRSLFEDNAEYYQYRNSHDFD